MAEAHPRKACIQDMCALLFAPLTCRSKFDCYVAVYPDNDEIAFHLDRKSNLGDKQPRRRHSDVECLDSRPQGSLHRRGTVLGHTGTGKPALVIGVPLLDISPVPPARMPTVCSDARMASALEYRTPRVLMTTRLQGPSYCHSKTKRDNCVRSARMRAAAR